MNREQREQYEQGDMGYSGHSVSESHPRFRLVFTHSSALDTDQATATKGAVFLETLPSLFAVFAHFAVRMTTNTLDEKHEPRTTRTTRTWRSKPIQTFAGFAQPPVVGWEREKTLLLPGI